MNKNTYYRQCQLCKDKTYDVAWIPAEFAVVGKYVKIKNPSGWDDGWKVVEAYPTKRTHADIIARGNDWKNTRKASDVQQ